MDWNWVLRIGLGIVLAASVGHGFRRAGQWESGERSDFYTQEHFTNVYRSPGNFAFLLLSIAALAAFFWGGIGRAVLPMLEATMDLSLYFLLLLFFLPLLRREFSARLCATLWLAPSFLAAAMNLFLRYRGIPLLVLPLPEGLPEGLGRVWLAGFLGVFGWRCLSDLRFRRALLRDAYPEEDGHVLRVWREVRAELRLEGQEIRLLRAPAAVAPLSLRRGLRQFATVLPEWDYPEEELRFLFSHELHHLQRRDIDTKVFLAFCQGLCWFNPLVWLAAEKGCDDLELSCDEIVLAGRDGEQRRSYARLLLQSAAEGRGFTTCLSARGKSLRYRLENVLKPRKHRSGTVLLAAVTLALFLSWGRCAISTAQGTLGELALPEGLEGMDVEITLTEADGRLRTCPEPERLLAELAEIPVWELRSLGQVEDGGSPTLSVALNQYHVLRELRSRTVTPGFGWASGRGVFWMPREDVDWERIRAFFPEEGA